MLATLLESHAVPQRRGGGVALSATVHVAIIGAVAVAGAHVRPVARNRTDAVPVRFTRPVAPTPVARSNALPGTRALAPRLSLVEAPHIAIPTTTPTSLPPIDLSHASSATDPGAIILGGAGGGRVPSLLDGGEESTGGGWSANEVLMHILTSSEPRYPESLRRAGVSGRVLVRFTVDTAGRIDMQTVQILSATHELFARAVRDVLPNFRFRPAEVGGRKVPALAEMPFEFDVR